MQITGIPFASVSLDLPELQAISVADVVREKARAAFAVLGEPVLVEDTGLSFDAWNGLPGALIKWFLETVGNAGILRMLESESNRNASAVSRLCWFDGHDFHEFEGVVRGRVTTDLRGTGGFGWDALFIPEGHDVSFAEMTSEEKNSVSMRARAFLAMREALGRNVVG
ncbi:MAG: RdgB/HAM1 family non-canonical purine pyrophosphatase [Candidatus Parcubacteria bacterium]